MNCAAIPTRSLLLSTLALPLALLAPASLQAHADVIVLNAAADVMLLGANSNVRGNYLGVNSGGDGNPLIRFDTSGLAAAINGGTINSVTLSLTFAAPNLTMASPRSLDAFQLVAANAGWNGVGNVGFGGSTAASGSYKDTPNTTAWASGASIYAAGNTAGTVMAADISSVSFVTNTTYVFTMNNAVITNWINTPALADAGILLATSGGFVNRDTFYFYTMEAATAGYRPTITVDYTPIPEPASLALLGLGGLLMLGRSRKASRARA